MLVLYARYGRVYTIGMVNKTQPTQVSVDDFLQSVSSNRRSEAVQLIEIMHAISGDQPVMWGPSIIGFGTQHYKYDTGREGDVPRLSFSPRQSSITVYFEGFDRYADQLQRLGKYKSSVACLYINKLADINLDVLTEMLQESFATSSEAKKPATVDEYIAAVPTAALPKLTELRRLVAETLPHAKEVYSYGIIGYKIDDKRARVFVSGWNDHVAVYPIPKNLALQERLRPYTKGIGTLWFSLDQPLPTALLVATIKALSE